MKLYPDSKVYILCPANFQTGGPELAHQLASTLISFGVQAYICYYELSGAPLNRDDPVHDVFKKYHVPYVFSPEDSERNIIVAPETVTEFLYLAKKIQHVIWWMAVDNYFIRLKKLFNIYLNDPLNIPMEKIFYLGNEDSNITHFVQSEYARQFLKLNGIPDSKIFTVEDYLNQAFLNRAANVDLSLKENFVAYNPKKGFEITQQLINIAPDINWRPIQNMTPEQVQELLAKSKVYIDFGSHPGKDRIPREAAISGCVVIVGKRGAAVNDVDINIPAEFKFDDSNLNPQQVIDKIREVFENFPAAHEKQAAYRARILDDKNRFTKEVAAAFEIENFLPPNIAFVQGISNEIIFIAKEIWKNGLFVSKFIVDDAKTTEEAAKNSYGLIVRNQNRNYLRLGENFIEIITWDDAEFLYREGRIKNFALFEPTDAELDELKNFCKPNYADIVVFNR